MNYDCVVGKNALPLGEQGLRRSADPEKKADNRRRHLRIELYATVALKAPDETFILTLRNLSIGGAFLLADGHDLSTVDVGGEHEVVIVDGENPDREVTVTASVVRNAGDGLAVKWIGENDAFKVASLLDLYAPAHELLAVPPTDNVGATAKRHEPRRSALAWLLGVRRREPAGRQLPREVRLKLEALPRALRAVARDQSQDSVMIEAELPWLTVGGAVAVELPDGPQNGRVHWFSIDATRAGAACLCISVDLTLPGSATAKHAASRTRDRGPARRRAGSRAFWPAIAAASALAGLVGGHALPHAEQPALLASPVEVEPARPHWPRTIPNVLPKQAPDSGIRPEAAGAPTRTKPNHHRHHR